MMRGGRAENVKENNVGNGDEVGSADFVEIPTFGGLDSSFNRLKFCSRSICEAIGI